MRGVWKRDRRPAAARLLKSEAKQAEQLRVSGLKFRVYDSLRLRATHAAFQFLRHSEDKGESSVHFATPRAIRITFGTSVTLACY